MMYRTAVEARRACRRRRRRAAAAGLHCLLYSLANNKWFTMKYAVVLATDVDVKSVQIVVFAT